MRDYNNYNNVEVFMSGADKILVKSFSEEFQWQNETKAIDLLNKHKLPVPKLINSSYLKNTYYFIEEPCFYDILKDYPKKIFLLTDLMRNMHAIRDSEFNVFGKEKEKIILTAQNLLESKCLRDELFDKIYNIACSYQKGITALTHGDFRLNHFFGDSHVKAMIDFEYTGINDPHKDMAFLWTSATNLDNYFDELLVKEYEKIDYFDHSSFKFWKLFFAVMAASNPHSTENKKWVDSIEIIVK